MGEIRCDYCGAEGLYFEEGYRWVLMDSGGVPHHCDPIQKEKWKNRGHITGEMIPEKKIREYKYVDSQGKTITFQRYLELQKIRQQDAIYNEKRNKELKEEMKRWSCPIRNPTMEKFWRDFRAGRYILRDRSWFGKIIYDGSNIPSPTVEEDEQRQRARDRDTQTSNPT